MKLQDRIGRWAPWVAMPLALALVTFLGYQTGANAVALISFLIASTFASRVVATARREAAAAQRRRQEVEILYELSFALFAVSQRPGVLGEAAARTLRGIGADSGLLLLGDTE